MRRIAHRSFSHRRGQPPGTLLNDRSESHPSKLRRIRYSGAEWVVEEEERPDGAPPESGAVEWVQVYGIHDGERLAAVGAHYGIHRLVLEDIQNTDRRPVFEDKDDYLFLTLKRLIPQDDRDFPTAETVSVILKGSTVLSFHDADSQGYPDLEQRIKSGGGRIRKSDASYLAYALLDESIDTWLVHSEEIENGLLEIEESILFHYRNELITQIHQWKKHIAWLRWLFRPYRDFKIWLWREGTRWFPDEIFPYASDVSDHATRILDILELYRDMVEDLLTVHMTALSNHMNSIMKVLTVISTIFIPMTFLAGIYGMNFHRMPELAWRWGYPAALGLMAAAGGLMVFYFKRKKWL